MDTQILRSKEKTCAFSENFLFSSSYLNSPPTLCSLVLYTNCKNNVFCTVNFEPRRINTLFGEILLCQADFSLCFTSKTSVNSTNQKENLRFFGIFVQLSTNQGEKVRFSEKFYYARLTFSLCFTSKTSVNSTNQKENLRFVGVFCTVKYEPVYF